MKPARILLHFCWIVPALLVALYFANPSGTPTWDPRGRVLGVIPYRVPSVSMAPSLPKGSLVVVCTWIDRDRPPERGDVIVFRAPGDRAAPYLKRVVGIAGDRVAFEGHRFLRDGVVQNEPYAVYEDIPDDVPFSAQVPAGHVFVAGDNRMRSEDSRHFGPVPVGDIVGKVCRRL